MYWYFRSNEFKNMKKNIFCSDGVVCSLGEAQEIYNEILEENNNDISDEEIRKIFEGKYNARKKESQKTMIKIDYYLHSYIYNPF